MQNTQVLSLQNANKNKLQPVMGPCDIKPTELKRFHIINFTLFTYQH